MKTNTPLKIWILKDGETPPTERNAKKMRTWKLGEALSERGHSVTWWTSNFYHSKKEKICEGNKTIYLRDNFKVNLIDCGIYKKNLSWGRIKHHFLLGENFFSLAQKEEVPDIIIASLPIIEFPIKAIKYSKNKKIPVIIDVRDMWPDIFMLYVPYFLRIFLWVPLLIYNRNLKFFLRKSQGIVSMNEDLLQWALDKSNLKRGDNTKIFYLGYDESCAKETESIIELKTIPKNKKIFSYLGSFNKSNEIDLIVEAAKILEQDPTFNAHFILAGDGDSWNFIKEKAKGMKNITLLSWLNKGQSSYLMKRTDVSIIPSKVPAIPNKFFEALFFGNPIIFSMEGESKAILENHGAGLFYKKGDVNSLICSINNILKGKKLQEMKKNSRGLYDKNFTHKKIYSEYCKYIENIKT